MKRVAIVGIQGVPAKYGGFETLVENIIGDNCSPEVCYTVFCSGKDYTTRQDTYKGVRLNYIPFFHANGVQSTPYDILSMLKCLRGYDTVVVLGVSGCVFLPIADVIVADNKGIQDYVTETYGKKSELIAYGGDHTQREVSEERQHEILNKYGVKANTYSISVCRIEPENNSHILCEAFAKSGKDLVFVGNWNRSDYSRNLKKQYSPYRNIHLVDSVYDLDELYALRNQCECYIHGHSAGGTNPSLVEAMSFGKPIIAFDVIYNRETTENKAYYFKDCEELVELLHKEKDGTPMKEIVQRRYTWKHIAEQYEAIY